MRILRVLRTCAVLVLCVDACTLQVFAQRTPPRAADTLLVDQRSVVFYTPSIAQRTADSTSRHPKLDSLAVRFDATRRGVIPFLRKVGIVPVSTDKAVLRFVHGDSVTWVQRKTRDFFGVILFAPGKAPDVIRGVPTDVEVLKRMFPYYGIR